MSRFESLRCYATHRFMGRARFVELLLTGSNYIYIYIYIYKGRASRSCSTTRSTTHTITSRSPTSSGLSLSLSPSFSPTLSPASHHPSHPRSRPPARRPPLKQPRGSAVKSLKPTGIIGVSAQVGALAGPAAAAFAPGASADGIWGS